MSKQHKKPVGSCAVPGCKGLVRDKDCPVCFICRARGGSDVSAAIQAREQLERTREIGAAAAKDTLLKCSLSASRVHKRQLREAAAAMGGAGVPKRARTPSEHSDAEWLEKSGKPGTKGGDT